MKLINKVTAAFVILPDELQWDDELKWSPVVATLSYSVTGAMLLQIGRKLGGRPITLSPPEASMAWVPRSTVLTLSEWSATLRLQMTLELGPQDAIRRFNVVFRHADKPVEAEPVKGFPDFSADPWMKLTVRLMEY